MIRFWLLLIVAAAAPPSLSHRARIHSRGKIQQSPKIAFPPLRWRLANLRAHSTVEVWEKGTSLAAPPDEQEDSRSMAPSNDCGFTLADVPKKIECSWTLRTQDGREQLFIKKKGESREHVLMKAMLWAMNEPLYPGGVSVERFMENQRYKPDCVALDPTDRARVKWWGEAGGLSDTKWQSLIQEYPDASFTFAKWGVNLKGVAAIFSASLRKQNMRKPRKWMMRQKSQQRGTSKDDKNNIIELLSFPVDTADCFLDLATGEIRVPSNSDQIQRITLSRRGEIIESNCHGTTREFRRRQ